MATCKDCICYEILCQHALQEDELKLCESFKNKADFVEVKRGHWVRNEPNPEQLREFRYLGIGKGMVLKSIYWTCSCCGTWGTPRYKYCFECGAKMGGGNK